MDLRLLLLHLLLRASHGQFWTFCQIYDVFLPELKITPRFCFSNTIPDNLFPSITVVQGISYWSVGNKSTLRGRRIHNFIELWCLVGSGGLDIWVSSTSFQKSNIGWPQQPLTERVLKFNMIFPYSTPIFFFKTSK